MKIEKIAIAKINPAPYNPRKDLKTGDVEYEKLKKSILAFDMVEPLVWNKRSGNLVGGHQRLKVLKEIGQKEIEVSVVDLPDDKEKALNLALNKISGEWDFPMLKDILQELDTGAFDIEITGFDSKEIEDLLTQFHIPEEGQTDDDEVLGNNPLGKYFIYNPKWNNRRYVKYFSLYSYKADKHDEAVQYFKAIKKECSEVLIKQLSQFIAEELNKTFRNVKSYSISHCPKTHSKGKKHFATELAKSLSNMMGLEYRKIFKDRELKGSTSPRNYYTRLTAEIEGKLDKPLILIDDIASSGTTMESCINALGNRVCVIPVVLIYEDVKG